MSWSKDYKKSIDCDNPKGFSQKAHCAARRKRAKGEETKSKSPFSEGTLHHWFKGSKSKDGKPGWVQADGSPCANEPGETKTPKCFSSARLKSLKSKGEKGEELIKSAIRRKRQKDKGQQQKSGAAAPTNVPTFAKGKKDPNYVKAEPGIKEAMELNEAQKDRPGEGSGKKDACYHKVKSRYDVWPSAYASGALVKCRKVGASNWGTKTEETSLNYDWDTPIRERPDRYCPKCEKLELRDECRYGPKYWDMYSLPAEIIKNKKDYKITMPYPGPNTIPSPPALSLNQMKYNIATVHPANEEKDHEYSMARSELSTIISAAKRLKKKMKGEGSIEAWVQSKITKAADYIDTAADYVESGEHNVDEACWDGYKQVGMKKKGGKMVPNCVKEEYSNWREELSEDWQKVNRQDKTDGLSQKAVDAYRRENPGSKLQTAVTEKKPKGKRAKRRANFCRRMKGMKSKLTSAETARDPDSRINKALRRWNCN